MSILGKVVKDALTGVGIIIVAPILSPVLGKIARPAAKAAIKTYLSAAERFESAAAEVKKEWSDLVAEARAERSKAPAGVPEATPFSPV